MKFHLAEALQRKWVELPPSGWTALRHASLANINTHKEASLYEAFPPEKARGLCERFEMRWARKHGRDRDRTSWTDLPGSQDRLGRGIHRRSESLSRP